jgi:hypothetical protein
VLNTTRSCWFPAARVIGAETVDHVDQPPVLGIVTDPLVAWAPTTFTWKVPPAAALATRARSV